MAPVSTEAGLARTSQWHKRQWVAGPPYFGDDSGHENTFGDAPRRVRQLNPQHRFPDARTLDWVARAVAPGAGVMGGRRLMGGVAWSIHRLAVETRSGERRIGGTA